MYTNYTIQISIRCPSKFSEVLTGDVESTALALENGMHVQMVELFGEGVIIDYVVVQQTLAPGKATEGMTFRA